MLIPSAPSSFAAAASAVAVAVGGGAGAWSLQRDWFSDHDLGWVIDDRD